MLKGLLALLPVLLRFAAAGQRRERLKRGIAKLALFAAAAAVALVALAFLLAAFYMALLASMSPAAAAAVVGAALTMIASLLVFVGIALGWRVQDRRLEPRPMADPATDPLGELSRMISRKPLHSLLLAAGLGLLAGWVERRR